ncbi:basal cell adhesion molecule [Erinaceus europaeus]|uniref:Basal cell adhesion molecule n=1 Tax=Erinaceus europaeus TaxID=9365 RepID=A0ABM3X027_ERIEU|nr:basal cell adhesion molecule [Erinaceus europaeus]
MEPPDSRARARRAPRLLALALLLGAHPGAQAEMRVSVPPLVEVMRGDPVTLDCTPLGAPDHLVLEWYLVDRGTRHLLASVELRGSDIQGRTHDSRGRNPPYQLDPRGRLVLAAAQVGDEKDYVCLVKSGASSTAEATARLRVFAKPEATEVLPNKGTLSVLEDTAQEVATCSSFNGNPAPEISWYRDGQLLKVPKEMKPDGYVTTRTVKETSGLQSLTSTLYLRVHKADRDSSFHCSARYRLPGGRQGRLDSASFHLTLHYPTEHVQFWVGSPATTEGWVREGDSVQLSCQGDGNPSPEYTFFHLQDNREDILQTNLEGSLTLEGVQRGQRGTYGCRVEDFDAAEDVELSQTLELRVAYLDPLELSTGEELRAALGNNVTINCSVLGLPTPTLRWTKDSVPLEDGPTLRLSTITFESTGTYTCEASVPTVPLLSRTRSFRLLVQGLPELRPEETAPQPEGGWREGDEVQLTCFARGYPEPKLTWNQPGGTAAEPAPGGQGWVVSTLKLKVTSTLSRDGVVCEASNPEGSASHVFHFGNVSPQSAQAGVAVLAVAVSVGLLLLVVAAFYCMRRKGRPHCCRRGEKGARPPGEPELSHSGSASERPEQTGLLVGGVPGGAQRGSGGFGDEC